MRFFILIACWLLFLIWGTGTAYAQVQPPKPRDSTIKGPQTFAMIMGISTYKYVRPLDFADKDALMFRDFLKSPAGGNIPDDNIYMLLNEQATLANFYSKGFQWLKIKSLQKGDRLFIYLAGHGDAIDEDQFFYLAYDCNPAGDKNNYLVSGAVQMYNVKIKIQKEAAKGAEVFLIMDACRSNELPGGAEGQSFFNSAISEKRAGEIIMLATGAGQESLEDASIGTGHGLFTWYLVDGLNGMADAEGETDQKVTVEEIQKYVQKNVPNVAQQRFKRKQDPFFCCTEHSQKVVSIVDPEYLKKWLQNRPKGTGNSFYGNIRSRKALVKDTLLQEAYTHFHTAIRENRLTGKNSAEYYYEWMMKNHPGNSYTIDAQSTLTVEYLNVAQNKINLYLDCKDPASIQKLRAQIDEEENADDMDASLERMEKVARQEFYEVGAMMEKAIDIIREDDPAFAKSLMGRMYFFKARGFFGKGRQKMDINKAFQYGWAAYASEKNASYVLQTLASLHLENNQHDSAVFYAGKAIATAPRWRYPYVTLAFCYKTLHKPDSAIKYYRKAIELNPGNADAYVDLGHYYYSLSRGDSATAYYEKALQIEPGNVYASNNIGWISLDRKDFQRAAAFFKRSIAADAKFINAYKGLSKSFVEQGMFDSARIYYSRAFANYQDKSFVNSYIGNFYRDLKQYDSAKTYYLAASMLDPNYEDALNQIGRACFALKQYDSAKIYYRKALSINPYSAFALMQTGIVFKELKQQDSASYFFNQAILMDPGNPVTLNNLGVLYAEEKNYDTAKKYFRKALEVKPGYKPASGNLMKIFRQLNQTDSITSLLQGISSAAPDSESFLNDIGLAFLQMNRHDSARKYFRRALQKDPANARSLSNMGLALQGIKLYDSARIYMQQAYRHDPENPVIWANLAVVFRQTKKYDSAGYYFRKQIMRKNDPPQQQWFAIGNFYEDMKVYDSAVIYFKKAAGADPGFTAAWSNAGQSYLHIEMYDSAMLYLQQAYRLDSNAYAPAHNLGLLYHSLGQYNQAIYYLTKAVHNDQNKNKACIELASSYALANQPVQAVEFLQKGIERGFKNFESLLDDPDLEDLKKEKSFQELMDRHVPGWRNR